MKTITEFPTIRFKGVIPVLFILLSGMFILNGCVYAKYPTATQTTGTRSAKLNSTNTPSGEATVSSTSTSEKTPEPISSLLPYPPSGEDEEMTIEPGLEPLVEQATADLARRLEVDVETIHILRAESITWPDSSLGCPQPGMAYLQVPEDGALIVLQIEGALYEYHNGGNRGLFLCEKSMKDPNPAPHLNIFNLTPSKSNPSTTSPTPENSIPPGEDD